jgi:hypothetical protein
MVQQTSPTVKQKPLLLGELVSDHVRACSR